jgi:hypothetical protein
MKIKREKWQIRWTSTEERMSHDDLMMFIQRSLFIINDDSGDLSRMLLKGHQIKKSIYSLIILKGFFSPSSRSKMPIAEDVVPLQDGIFFNVKPNPETWGSHILRLIFPFLWSRDTIPFYVVQEPVDMLAERKRVEE